MPPNIKLRRYVVPSLKGQGWGEFVIGDNGYFSVVSDYGNYAYRWPDKFGSEDMVEFRKFLLELGKDWDYLAKKLGGRRSVYSPEKTLRAVRTYILNTRREGRLGKAQARDEFDLIEDLDNLGEMCDFELWTRDTCIGDCWELCCYDFDHDIQNFCKVLFPRFLEVIKTELASEVKNAAESTA